MIRQHGVPTTNTAPDHQRRVRIGRGVAVTVAGRAGHVMRRIPCPYFRRRQVIFPDGLSAICNEAQIEVGE